MNDDVTPLGRPLPFASVTTLRDLGGCSTADGGRVRDGLVFCASDLGRLAGDDVAAFAALGVRTVFDLRTEAERQAAPPDRLPLSVELVKIDVLAGAATPTPAEIVTLPSALDGYRVLFTDLARPRHRPALVHGATGSGRTAWAAAALLLVLGVGEQEVAVSPFLEGAVTELHARFGGIAGYFHDGLRIAPSTQGALREIFTESRA